MRGFGTGGDLTPARPEPPGHLSLTAPSIPADDHMVQSAGRPMHATRSPGSSGSWEMMSSPSHERTSLAGSSGDHDDPGPEKNRGVGRNLSRQDSATPVDDSRVCADPLEADVLVVGAGPVGLSLALGLARAASPVPGYPDMHGSRREHLSLMQARDARARDDDRDVRG